MAISTTVSTAKRILAIDLGKYKSVECRYDASSGEVAFASFETTRKECTIAGKRADRQLNHSGVSGSIPGFAILQISTRDLRGLPASSTPLDKGGDKWVRRP